MREVFSGFHITACCYVSWALVITGMFVDLGMPFENEFKIANTLNKPNK